MKHSPDRTHVGFPAAHLRTGLQLLLEAHEVGHESGGDHWQYAVEFVDLYERGMSRHDLRVLIHIGWIEHAVEVTRCEDRKRQFRPHLGFGFDERSCAILSEVGAQIAKRVGLHGDSLVFRSVAQRIGGRSKRQLALKPTWDPRWRELRVGSHVCKRIERDAPCQVAILNAFQKRNWPQSINDPLTPKLGDDPKQRLNQTLKNLNRGQRAPTVHFEGDGSGIRIAWRIRGKSQE